MTSVQLLRGLIAMACGCGGIVVMEGPDRDVGQGGVLDDSCTAAPVCDPGDAQDIGDACVSKPYACYQTAICNVAISCWDNLPEHGCSQSEPTIDAACVIARQQCSYPVEGSPCIQMFECIPALGTSTDWHWADAGQACPSG